ncbi:hypothetical protein PIB30_051256 [Stylosanthes scabra]|uniref:Calmodulin-binding domain-containing protein n=1 Tax=Stylosanthes scabra TaxID=79078 RepID=A0ABU6ZGR8_9FABA|nr:hypothetical protein [Stylosanthes scabra]
MVMAVECTNNQVEPEYYIVGTTTTPKGIASRYLSARQGSCHDLCKSGYQNDAVVEAKPWKKAKKRVTSSTGGRKTKAQEENVTSLTGTKKSGSKSKNSKTSKFESSNSPIDIKEVINEGTVNSEKNSTPSEETNVSAKEHNYSYLRVSTKKPNNRANNSDIRKPGSHSKPSATSNIESSNIPVDTKEVIHEETVNSEKNSITFGETNVSTKVHKKTDLISSTKAHKKTDLIASTKKQTNSDLRVLSGLRVSTKEHNRRDLRHAQEESSKLLASIGDEECPRSQTKEGAIKNKVVSSSSSRKDAEISSKQKTRLALIEGKEKSVPRSGSLSSKHTMKKASSLSDKTSKNLKSASSRKGNGNVEAKHEIASNGISDEILYDLEVISEILSEEHGEPMSILSSGDKKSHSRTPSSSSLPLISSGSKGKKSHSRTSSSSSLPLITSGSNSKKSHKRTPSSSSLPLITSGSNDKKSHKRTSSSSSLPLISSGSKGKKSHSRSSSFSSDFSYNTFNGKQQDDNTVSGENVKMRYQVKPRASTLVAEANKAAPQKLTFRRGKVIEIQPQMNNVPRRLKFRPVRTLSHDNLKDINAPANVTTEKYSPAREEVEGPKPGSEEEVLLRPPSVEKKVNRRLYNNVIEETATMLAEVRKSKVKALVGAFETVISIDSRRQSRSTFPEVSTPC